MFYYSRLTKEDYERIEREMFQFVRNTGPYTTLASREDFLWGVEWENAIMRNGWREK